MPSREWLNSKANGYLSTRITSADISSAASARMYSKTPSGSSVGTHLSIQAHLLLRMHRTLGSGQVELPHVQAILWSQEIREGPHRCRYRRGLGGQMFPRGMLVEGYRIPQEKTPTLLFLQTQELNFWVKLSTRRRGQRLLRALGPRLARDPLVSC